MADVYSLNKIYTLMDLPVLFEQLPTNLICMAGRRQKLTWAIC